MKNITKEDYFAWFLIASFCALLAWAESRDKEAEAERFEQSFVCGGWMAGECKGETRNVGAR